MTIVQTSPPDDGKLQNKLVDFRVQTFICISDKS